MSLGCPIRQLARSDLPDAASRLSALLCSRQSRLFHASACRSVVPQFHKETLSSASPISKSAKQELNPWSSDFLKAKPPELRRTPAQAAAAAAAKAKANLKRQQQAAEASAQRLGGLARNSLFSDEEAQDEDQYGMGKSRRRRSTRYDPKKDPSSIESRSLSNMALVLNPRPQARSRWQRRMVIREIRRGGRLTKEMQIRRTERSHLSRSHFFKTSMKKLAPLARQIAGKSIDEAILQMRFSVKKVARDVRRHLIQARDEAIVARGMGIRTQKDETTQVEALAADPAIIAPLPHQTPTKSNKPGHAPHETDIYIAQAWVNRGPYGAEPDYRARGRVNIMRPPHTGISLLLKEEKTRTREKMEKEAKVIRKRMGKNMWTQLPDRKVTRQSQYVLW